MKTFLAIIFCNLVFIGLYGCASQGPTLQDRIAEECNSSQYSRILTEARLCGITDQSTLERELARACAGQYAIILRGLEICN